MKNTCYSIFAIALFIGVGYGSAPHRPIVQTGLGKVRGYTMTSRGGRQFFAFSGLPFTKPPIGELRFQPPLPAEPWTGIKDATKDGPICVQFNTFDIVPKPIGEEDCLQLSVYTHNLRGSAPVIMHIHGGGFISGNGPRLTGPQYLMDEDIVYVNINYRVAMFGFLSFEDLDLPGNQGLKDQVEALRWVQQNIASFGGDPQRVTIMGESAGAGSVYHHTISPLSTGLFHRAIAESGSSYNGWALGAPGSARNAAMVLLQLLGCNYTTTKAAVACLNSKDAYEIVSTTNELREWQIESKVDFAPTLEPPSPGAFLVGPVSKWIHKPVPMIMGSTSAEGLLRTIYFPIYNMSYEWFTENFEKLAPKSLKLTSTAKNPLEVARKLREYYLPKRMITEDDWVNLTTLYSDAWFNIEVQDGANRHPGGVYFYYFDYLGEQSFGGNATVRNDSYIFGAFHTDEIIYTLYQKDYAPLKGEDLQVSKKLVKLWTNLAKYGTPTPNGSDLSWSKWTPEKHSFLEINKEGFKMNEGLFEDRYRFWQTLNYYDINE